MIRESRVSKKFQEMTTKRVVSIVLVCIMCAPFLQPELYLYDFGVADKMDITDYLISIMKSQLDFDHILQPGLPCEEKKPYAEMFETLPKKHIWINKIEEYQCKSKHNSYIQCEDQQDIIDITILNCTTGKSEILYAFQDIEQFRMSDYETA